MFKWITSRKNKERQERQERQERIKDYEIEELKYSYRQMGKYVKRFDIPELADIEIRIENELRDIEVRKGWFAESHGIKGN